LPADRPWGRFDLHIAGRHPLLALVARMINWRSRLTGIATGDQAIFVTRKAFWSVGGFPDLPLMEDSRCRESSCVCAGRFASLHRP